MSLWPDKYQPKTLNDLTYHPSLTKRLKKLANSQNFPHTLFYGPTGAGKKTRLAALLRELFGPNVDRVKLEKRQFITASNRKLDFTIVSSNFHVEINPSNLGVHDRAIVQDVIKGIAQSQQTYGNFKAVVIHQADEMTREAQAGLRRTMEKYSRSTRLILCCNSLSKLIPPLRSRCMLLRVGRPETEEIVKTLQTIASKENISPSAALCEAIAKHCERNMRASVLTLECTATKNPDMSVVIKPALLDWEMVLGRLAQSMMEDQTPERVLAARSTFYDLLSKQINPTKIIKVLTAHFLDKLNDDLKPVIIDKAASVEHQLNMGRKDVIYLEMYATAILSILKRYFANL
ncbi:putative subunit of DNA replication factor C (RF-C) [Backusella circina FSU 941]|nr:putative subunit of DNA replication factor C (RF-C) [Backusella circina FSU 941]